MCDAKQDVCADISLQKKPEAAQSKLGPYEPAEPIAHRAKLFLKADADSMG